MRILIVDTSQYYPASPLFDGAQPPLSTKVRWEVRHFDVWPYQREFFAQLQCRLAHRLRRTFEWPSANFALIKEATNLSPDVILIVKGAWVTPETLHSLRSVSTTPPLLINYATDDPFNKAVSTQTLRDGIPLYDLYVSTKSAAVQDISNAGGKKTTYLPFAYKPKVHFPETIVHTQDEIAFGADVAFIGGCDADRVPYFDALLHELPSARLALYGSYWHRKSQFRRHYRGLALGRSYRLAAGCAKVVVNLCRKANRDGHVMRTFELPAMKATMIVERTKEHMAILPGCDWDAYFASPSEMVALIRELLQRPEKARHLASVAHSHIAAGNHTYGDRLSALLALAGSS